MPTFKNLQQMEVYLKKAIDDTIREELFPVVRDAWLDIQRERVYDVYNPVRYERRGDEGGLSDPDNIVITEKNTKDISEFILMNITKGSTEEFQNTLINKLIESQEGFAGNPSEGMPARPYTEETNDFLTRGIGRNQVMTALSNGLKKRGINIKFN